MAALKPVKFFTTSWMIIRHNSKPNIAKPRLPHWTRLKIFETCKPVFAPQTLTCDLFKNVKEEKLSTFERLLGEQMLKYFNESAMVGIYHANSITGRARFPLVRLMFYGGMEMKTYNKYIVKLTLTGTKYEAIIPLFSSHTTIVFGKNVDIEALLTIQKKFPTYLLLAGIVENRLMSRDELGTYSKLGDINQVRAQLCSTLNSVAQQLTQNLNHHQTQLGQSLEMLSKSS